MPSVFLGVYNAIYSYAPQSDQELALQEGDLLYVLEKSSDDDWWKAKKKSSSPDDDEPVGLVPSNYIEEAKPVGKYRAIYEYKQQTDEELSFPEEATLDVYDVSDPDWALVGVSGEYGFAPANYIEKIEESQSGRSVTSEVEQPVQSVSPGPKHVSFSPSDVERQSPLASPATPPHLSHSPTLGRQPEAPLSPTLSQEPTARASQRTTHPSSLSSSPNASARPHSSYDHPRNQFSNSGHGSRKKPAAVPTYTSDSDDSDGPRLPLRRPGEPRYGVDNARADSPPIPPGYQAYPVQEVDSKKKRAATLGLGSNSIILLPDKSSRPKEEWAIENLLSYNHEGKHVFLEFGKPSRSLDLHAGSTDAATEIIAAIGERRGAKKTLDLIGDLVANGGKKTNIGTVLYDFPAQGDDEVSVTVGDEVVILDDTLDEWWKVRRQVNGVEGVVPSSYIERGRSKKVVPKGIMESPGDPRIRVKSQHSHDAANESGPGGVPERRSSLHPQSRKAAPAKSKPDTTQIRTWTDRTGSFKVEAQFLGCRDGKIHLHKVNGVKIAVPVSKMALRDIEYVEAKTGMSLDEDKPLKVIQERQRNLPSGIIVDQAGGRRSKSPALISSGTPVIQVSKKDDYDWFDFFLGCGVDVNDCQRYALNFQRDNMDEKLLESITAENMRTLGLKEGDILRVMKKLDEKYGRQKKSAGFNSDHSTEHDGGSVGIFVGPDGTLKNNTRKSRPPPAIQTPGVVDSKAFVQAERPVSPAVPTPVSTAPPAATDAVSGFDDDAWAPKPSKNASSSQPPQTASPPPNVASVSQPAHPIPQPTPQPASQSAPQPTSLAPPQPTSTQTSAPLGALQDLSTLTLDTPPLQPTVKSISPQPSSSQPSSVLGSLPSQMPTVATQLSASPQPTPGFLASNAAMTQPPLLATDLANYQNTQFNLNPTQFTGRPRPTAPTIGTTVGGPLGIPPPPARPLSAPQNFNTGVGHTPPLSATYTGTPATAGFANYNPGTAFNQGIPSMAGMQTAGILQQPTGSSFLGNSGYQGNPGQSFPVMGGQPGFQMSAAAPPPTAMVTPGFGYPQPGFTSVPSSLPAPLIPQSTGMTIQPLQPQQTGPAPSVKFGMPAQRKLAPQPTGRANLSKATPENPFGF